MSHQDGMVLIEVLGGPVGPEGPPNAGVFIVGIANTWPPAATPVKGDLWIIPEPPPAGAPAWATHGHGAFWNGQAWVDAGLLRGPVGERGQPGPPLNVKGVADTWLPAAHPEPGDIWQLADKPIIGLPSNFKPGGAAAWDAVANKWVPLDSIRGPAGHSITVFGPSPTPPATALVSKGDVWLATDPSVFSATFDPSTIVQQPGPPGPQGPAGTSSFDIWRTTTGKLTAPIADFLDAMRGPKGDLGPRGPAGETFKVEGVVANEAALPATPPRLTTYIVKDNGSLYIYDPTSAAALPSGYVNLGKIEGPQGRPAYLSPEVVDLSKLPPKGSAGEMVIVKADGHIYGWNEDTGAWVDGGQVVSGIDDGTEQGQVPTWDDANSRWVGTEWVRMPTGNQEGDTPTWDDAQQEWVPRRPRMGDEDNVIIPTDPSAAEGAVPVYELAADEFQVRKLSITELEDGPGNVVPFADDVLAWDDAVKRWLPTTPAPDTLVGLADVDTSHVTIVSGNTLVYNDRSHKWRPGNPAAKLVDYQSTTQYVMGQAVYHEGRLWRALHDGLLQKPEIAMGAALLVMNADGGDAELPRAPTSISTAAPTGTPAVLAFLHLRWVSDTDWDVYHAKVDAATHKLVWELTTFAKKTVWRHVALPPPDTTVNNAILWVYGMPGSTTPPVLNQTSWTPLMFGDFLVSLADCDVSTAKNGDIITADGMGRFHALPPAAYTKAEVDDRLAKVLVGIEHGAAVQAITNTPPASPVADETYIVGTTPTGAWVGHANEVAAWNGTAWVFSAPQAKEAHLVEAEASIYAWSGTPLAWSKVSVAGPQGPVGPAGPKGDAGPVGPGLIQAMTVSAYNALPVKDPKVLYLTYGT